MEKVFGWSVALHGEKPTSRPCVWTPPPEETKISFPTDAKLYGKVMERLRSIAREAGIKLKQSYRFVCKKLLRATYNGSHPRRAKAARKATCKLRTCAGRLLREVQRKLPEEATAAHHNPSWSCAGKCSANDATIKIKSTVSTSPIPPAFPRARPIRNTSLAGR